jgi:glutamate-1-semialdehyde 2,1-aminomutase
MAQNILAIVQARMGSTRFPNKVMCTIEGIPMIELLLRRLAQAKNLSQIILATSNDPGNLPMIEHVRQLGFRVYQGSESDVLDRYYQAAAGDCPDTVVRITGDCPLIDPKVVDYVIEQYSKRQVDYASNTHPPTFPDGLDTEVFSFSALQQAWKNAKSSNEREHVTPYLRDSGEFRLFNVENSEDFSGERWTVDEPKDFEVIQNVFLHFSPRWDFGWHEVLKLRSNHPELFEANQHIVRNDGAMKGTGQKLWNRAKRVIPGGNMLLSKRAEMYLPEQWPAYFSRAKGCRVWDLDGNEYIDMSIMGIGTNILGYGHSEVDEAVRKTVELGNMSTFNCPEEVYLAERLIDLHPWADMARFARSGGEANAIAIRIARAAAGKDKVAICGYHGWHDWYLSANLGNESSLDGHLLPGLEPRGVPRSLRGTTLPFKYNDFDSLQQLVQQHEEIGVIKMEVSRSVEPVDGFLESIRKLATEKNIVLIFDECTSAFRETFGGLHKKYGVDPDMAVFGKALGNGYAITACIGRREIMEAAQSTFISSTFWTERIGPTAGLKTLEIMEREASWEQITKTGKSIGERWKALAQKHDLALDISGLPALISFTMPGENWLKYKTFITQEMLKAGVLAANSVYVCTEHSQAVIDEYFDKLDPVFGLIRECKDGRLIEDLLEGPVCHAGFGRIS